MDKKNKILVVKFMGANCKRTKKHKEKKKKSPL